MTSVLIHFQPCPAPPGEGRRSFRAAGATHEASTSQLANWSDSGGSVMRP